MIQKSLLSALILTVLVFTFNLRAQDTGPSTQTHVPSGPIEIVETGKFMFKAVRAFPSGGGGGVDMSGRSNKVEMNGDSATADMAFFGTNSGAPFNNNSAGIEFDGKVSNKKVKKKEKKAQIVVSFSIPGIRDSYKCIFSISGTGPSTLNVSSNKKSPISYKGYIYMLPEK